MSDSKKVAVIILNWNGANDTIECLESLLKSGFTNHTIFLVDNNSQDDSLKQIIDWLEGKSNKNLPTEFKNLIFPFVEKPQHFEICKVSSDNNEFRFDTNNTAKIKIITNNENLGFAKANNQVINHIIKNKLDFDYFYLLNNDTIINKNTISELINHLENNNFQISNSIIYNYYLPSKIDFAGGRLFPWGKAKYYYSLPDIDFQVSEFAHGCAMMVKKDVFEEYGVLTEKFFHGEEDFEFSWRLRKKPVNISCCTNSVVYHKEGASVDKYIEKKKEKLVLSALNRIIDMKYYFNPYKWSVWKFIVLGYYLYLFKKLSSTSFMEAVLLLFDINKYSNEKWVVNKKLLDQIVGKN